MNFYALFEKKVNPRLQCHRASPFYARYASYFLEVFDVQWFCSL